MISSQKSSLTADVYGHLRGDILAGRFAPGQRLRPGHLATQRGVGLNAVREALSRLAGEGLVQAAPHHGFRVVDFSIDDITDATRVRVLLEGAALRRSIEAGDLTWETELVAAHHRLAHTPVTLDAPDELNPDWMQAHGDFHAATMSACGSPRLIEMTTALAGSMAITIYQHWAELHLYYSHDRRDAAAEHKAIFEAVIARDTELACRLNDEHNQQATNVVVDAMRKSAEPAQKD
ncbi:GntR family transcriptional regulator [Streptomyces sp. NPDC056296]|uniref:GntR family transcriptional regulator n=1 Tax=Streptomyces sp. NPDC056296 TaxID=3345775 RepID=UPI0035D6A612